MIIRIGTRSSRLALAQARQVKRQLERKFHHEKFRLVKVKTLGDEFQTVELFKKNQTGVFTKAIERKLLNREIDIAVHSLKDLPTRLPRGLVLAAVPARLDARDALVSKRRWRLSSLPKGARVGTGSPRRKRQLFFLRPDLELVDLKGNLDTRVKKVLGGELDALVVARAGLVRLKKYLKYASILSPHEFLPAVGQGALGLEARQGDVPILKMLQTLNHRPSLTRALAERFFLNELEGGCRVPVGIYSKVANGRLYLKAAVFSSFSSSSLSAQASGRSAHYRSIARHLARQLLKKGAWEFLREARGFIRGSNER